MTDRIGWVEVGEANGDPIAYVHGEIDISNVDQVNEELGKAFDRNRGRSIIDLSHTGYLDSTGVRLLYSLATRLRTGRQELHVVVPATSRLRRVLTITDMPSVIPTHADMESAIAIL